MGETYTAHGRPVYSMRLGKAERLLLAAAAAARGEAVSAFIRERALEAARKDLGIESEAR